MTKINLLAELKVWGTAEFANQLKATLEKMSVTQLPLQRALSFSNIALDTNIKAILLATAENENQLLVKVGLFYTGLVSGCHCADDPSPMEEQNEYCEVQLNIDKHSGDASIELLAD